MCQFSVKLHNFCFKYFKCLFWQCNIWLVYMHNFYLLIIFIIKSILKQSKVALFVIIFVFGAQFMQYFQSNNCEKIPFCYSSHALLLLIWVDVDISGIVEEWTAGVSDYAINISFFSFTQILDFLRGGGDYWLTKSTKTNDLISHDYVWKPNRNVKQQVC